MRRFTAVCASFLIIAGDLAVAQETTSVANIQRANKEIVRRFVDEVQTGKNLDLVDQLFSPDLKMHGSSQDSDGINTMKTALKAFFNAFPDLEVEILTQVAEGDVVATHKVFRGTHLGTFMGVAATRRQVEFDVMEFLVLREGKITEHWGMPRIPVLMRQIQD